MTQQDEIITSVHASITRLAEPVWPITERKDEHVNESKYRHQTQAACPILCPLSDLGEHWRRSGYRFEPSSSVWRFNQWLACCTGFHLWHGHSDVSAAALVAGSSGVVDMAGVESDEPQKHMGSHRSSALWRHRIHRRAW